VIQVEAKHHGKGAKQASSMQAGNLHSKLPICKDLRVMLLRSLSSELGLVNGSKGHIYDFSRAPNADPERDPPEVIMVAFDNYEDEVSLMVPARSCLIRAVARSSQFFEHDKSSNWEK
jgi:hypothetical protein